MSPPDHRPLLEDLRGVLGPRGVEAGDPSTPGDVTDETGRFGVAPLAVVHPAGIEEVADVIAVARAHRIGLVPQGGRTSLVGGSVPSTGGEVVVSSRRMASIGEIDLDGGRIRVDAGVTLADIERALAPTPWRYAIDFAARDGATIGGTVATNAGGARAFRHGMTRDQLRGISAVFGNGARIEHLRGLRKDNTGYDLAGLLCGSEGTLGIVCEVRARLIERLPVEVVSVIGLPDLATATRRSWAIAREVAAAEEIELVSRAAVDLVSTRTGTAVPVAGDWLVFVRMRSRNRADADAGLEALGRCVGDHSADMVVVEGPLARRLFAVREGITDALRDRRPVLKYDVSFPPDELAASLDEIRRGLSEIDPHAELWLFGHVCDHNIHVNVTRSRVGAEEVDDLVLGTVIERGGSISAEHGIGVAKVDLLRRNRDPGSLAAMGAVKAALDPDGVLNPGVLLRPEPAAAARATDHGPP